MPISALAMPLIVAASLDATRLRAAGAELAQEAPPIGETVTRPGAVPVDPAREPPASGSAAGQGPAAASQVSSAGTGPDETPDEIIVSASPRSDPAQKLNAVSYDAVQAVDSALVGPIAHTYESIIPKPARDGLHNVLDNLDEPIVFLNFLLQLKIGKAAETAGRFVINTTLGVGGLFDIAKRQPFNLPRRSNGLADTLGYYGVGPGPYLFLPVIGSTTLRDLLARPFDLVILPRLVPRPFADPSVSLAKGAANALDERYQDDAKITAVQASHDPYTVQREEYLARRRAEIEVLKGKRKSIYEPPYYDIPGFNPQGGDGAAAQEHRSSDSLVPQVQAGKEENSPALFGADQR